MMKNLRLSRYPLTRSVSPTLPLLTVGLLVLVVSVWAMMEHRWVLLANVLVASGSCGYFLWRPGFTSAFQLMVLTLPMTTGLLIDIGGNLRLTFIFAVLALVMAFKQNKLRLPNDLAIQLLIAFTVYALISTFYVIRIPEETLVSIIPSGFRLTPYRAFVQWAQLGLMLVAFCLTINFVTTQARLRQIVNLIFWAAAITTVYASYEFIAASTDIPFISLNTNADSNPARLFAGTMSRTGVGVSLARPRALTEEPQILAIILLFLIPFCVAAISLARTRWDQLLKISITTLATLIFLAANSKGSLIAIPGILLIAIVLAKDMKARVKMVLAGAVVYLLMAVVVFPLMDAPRSIALPMNYFHEQVKAIINPDLWGRSYDRPLEVIRENTLFGVGIGNYPFYAPEPSGEVRLTPVYSLQLRLLAELGLIGTALFFSFMGIVVWRLFLVVLRPHVPSLRPVAYAALISISGVMVASLGLDHMFNSSWLWVMLGIGYIIPFVINQVEAEPIVPEAHIELGRPSTNDAK
jgi:hypothetical protein